MSTAMVDPVAPESPVGYEMTIKRDGVVMATVEQVAGQWCLRVVTDGTALFCDSATEAVEQFYVHAECDTN